MQVSPRENQEKKKEEYRKGAQRMERTIHLEEKLCTRILGFVTQSHLQSDITRAFFGVIIDLHGLSVPLRLINSAERPPPYLHQAILREIKLT
jgi:hypothetical protein